MAFINPFTGGPVGSGSSSSLTAPVTITGVTGSSALTVNGATQTSSFPVFDATQTWNNVATTFTGLKLNVTDTASAVASLLVDWQVGGASKFKVQKDGTGTLATGLAVGANTTLTNNYLTMQGIRLVSYTNGVALLDNTVGGACLLWTPRYLVGNLPAANTCDGAFAMVSDATATTARSTAAGGGANKVMVQSDGTNWIIIG